MRHRPDASSTISLRLPAVAGALAFVAALLVGAPATAATTRCVGHVDGCFTSLQNAVNASNSGDTIRIRRGTFAGGVTIDKSLHLVGAGAGRTVIRGGGPVLTITSGISYFRRHGQVLMT